MGEKAADRASRQYEDSIQVMYFAEFLKTISKMIKGKLPSRPQLLKNSYFKFLWFAQGVVAGCAQTDYAEQ